MPENLSVDNVDGSRDVAEGNDCCSQVVERGEAAFQLLVSNQQLAEAIEPTVVDLVYPAPSLLVWMPALGLGLAFAVNDMSDVAVSIDDTQVLRAAVARGGA
jgi:hypothetical protein